MFELRFVCVTIVLYYFAFGVFGDLNSDNLTIWGKNSDPVYVLVFETQRGKVLRTCLVWLLSKHRCRITRASFINLRACKILLLTSRVWLIIKRRCRITRASFISLRVCKTLLLTSRVWLKIKRCCRISLRVCKLLLLTSRFNFANLPIHFNDVSYRTNELLAAQHLLVLSLHLCQQHRKDQAAKREEYPRRRKYVPSATSLHYYFIKN